MSESNAEFCVPDLKMVGSSHINLNELSERVEYDRVTVKVKVMGKSERQKLPGNKNMVLQDITNSPSEHRVKG